MHHHLALVKTLQPNRQANVGESPYIISEMDIILFQALLMDAGSATFKAIKQGEIEGILAGLVALAYASLQPLAAQDKDIGENEGELHQEYQLYLIMRQLSDTIHKCSSGQTEHYSKLYHLCAHFVSSFLNADFDKAFQLYHDWRIACDDSGAKTTETVSSDKPKRLDLIDCFYE